MGALLNPQSMNAKVLLDNVPFDIHFNGLTLHIIRFSQICSNKQSWVIPFHAHESYEFHYISAGEGHVDIEAAGLEVKKGDFYITAPYVRHKQASLSSSIMEEYCVECQITWSDDTDRDICADDIRQLKELSAHSFFSHFKSTDEMQEDLLRIEKYLKNDEFGQWLNIQMLLVSVLVNSLCIAASQSQSKTQYIAVNFEKQRFTRIINYLDGHLCSAVSVNDVADAFHLSSRQLDRILLKNCGMTFYKYLTELRLKMALQMIGQGQESMQTVALSSGFTGYQQLYRVLKRNHYPCPLELKKLMLKSNNG